MIECKHKDRVILTPAYFKRWGWAMVHYNNDKNIYTYVGITNSGKYTIQRLCLNTNTVSYMDVRKNEIAHYIEINPDQK